MKATAQIFVNPSIDMQTAFEQVKVLFQVAFADKEVTYTAYYADYDTSVGSLSYIPECCINGLPLVVADTEIFKDIDRMKAIHSACLDAFSDYFKDRVSLRPVHGNSIKSCGSYSEDGCLSPRAESFLNNSYFVSIFCDESGTDGNDYLVSLTPYNATPDTFDYNEVESIPFLKGLWFDDYDKARAAYKSMCIEYIGKGLQ
ncbi:TPA: hypothetical protein U9M35_002865 [Acinetobacter baumannii]|nr:hypothetical protein [Acinetobacter baumannii]